MSEEENLIIIMGLDFAGKSSLFNNFFQGEFFNPMPTELCDEFKHEFYGLDLKFREIGGRYRFMSQWSTQFPGAKGLIWVVDSIDMGRRTESKEELDKILEHPILKDLPVLIIFNKQDSPYKMSWEDIDEKFQMEKFKKERSANHIFTSHRTCEYMAEGLLWLVEAMGLKPVFEEN